MTACNTMRATVTLSAILLVSGLSLLPIAEIFGVMVPTAHAALLMVLAGAAVLAFAFLSAVLPGGAHRLDKCRH